MPYICYYHAVSTFLSRLQCTSSAFVKVYGWTERALKPSQSKHDRAFLRLASGSGIIYKWQSYIQFNVFGRTDLIM